MTKSLLIITIIIGCIIGFTYNTVLFLSIALIIFYIVVLFALLLRMAKAALRFLPSGTAKNYRNNEIKFKAAILTCSAFLYLGGWAINHYCLPHKLHPASLLGNIGILLFTIFLGWALLNTKKRKKAIFAAFAAFILFIFALGYAGAKTYSHVAPSGLDVLKSLPYLTWVPAEGNIEQKGVVAHIPDLAYRGLNIYTYSDSSRAYLMDMFGRVIHTWSSGMYPWHHVEMYDNGDLLGIAEDNQLVKLDWNSNRIWEKKGRFHHDVAIAENEDIYVVSREDEVVFYRGVPMPVLNDYILVLSRDGEVKEKISIFEILKTKISLRALIRTYGWLIKPHTPLNILEREITKRFAFEGWFRCPADVFHTNTVEIIKKDIKGLCKKGDLLICVRNFDLVGILDAEKKTLIWQWGTGDLRMPHNPTMLKNGNILIFDNGWERGYSRIVELDPLTMKIVWEYKPDLSGSFFSLKRGTGQRLPNGNTLITESDKGHVFEITRGGKIVWEFYSSEIKGEQRKAIYRMMRIINTKRLPLK